MGKDEKDDGAPAEAWHHAADYFASCMGGYLFYMLGRSRMTTGQAIMMHAQAIDEMDES